MTTHSLAEFRAALALVGARIPPPVQIVHLREHGHLALHIDHKAEHADAVEEVCHAYDLKIDHTLSVPRSVISAFTAIMPKSWHALDPE